MISTLQLVKIDVYFNYRKPGAKDISNFGKPSTALYLRFNWKNGVYSKC